MVETRLQPSNVDVRIKLDADAVRIRLRACSASSGPGAGADLEAAEIGGVHRQSAVPVRDHAVHRRPGLLVFLALVRRPRVNRIANIALSIIYALTIVAARSASGASTSSAASSRSRCSGLSSTTAWTWPT
jgi:hypothetical protein